MSIRQVQISEILEQVAESFFMDGINPRLDDILRYVSDYFSQYPAGLPLPIPQGAVAQDVKSDVDKFNQLLAHLITNVDVLYEASQSQLQQVLMLNTAMRSQLDRLKAKRKVLESKIDDYLLSAFNTDGYLYSISDSFADLSLTDLGYTTAFVDTVAGNLTIPSVSSFSKKINFDRVSLPNVLITPTSDFTTSLAFEVKSPIQNAFDGLNNTAWIIEARTDSPMSVSAVISMAVGTSLEPSTITRCDLTPFGVRPVQCLVQYAPANQLGTTQYINFSNKTMTSSEKMTYIADNVTAANNDAERMQFLLTKKDYDYKTNDNGKVSYRYIFGFREIALLEQAYDTRGVYVSRPLSILENSADNLSIIDAVSVVVDQHVPFNTATKFYVAADNVDAESVTDFDWKEIVPVGNTQEGTIAKFQGTLKLFKNIKRNPVNTTDVQLIPFDSSDLDLARRNPSTQTVAGVDIYRIASFSEDFIPATAVLEEGVNTTRILFAALDVKAITQGLSWWTDYVNGTKVATDTYGTVNSGHEFFYGGDVGESGKSVFIESFVEIDSDLPIMLKEFRKTDNNSQAWDVRVYLNGREVGYLPVGTNYLRIPWNFQRGRNHVIVLVNIPASSTALPSPYIGSLELMSDANLYDIGRVNLAVWDYVDFFKLQYNQINNANSFTIYNNEIISRKKPTDNFKLSYSKASAAPVQSVRFRADLTRTSDTDSVTPIVNSYRLRFAYA